MAVLLLTVCELRIGRSNSRPRDRCCGDQAPFLNTVKLSPIETYLAGSGGAFVDACAGGTFWRGSPMTFTSAQKMHRRRRNTAGTAWCALMSTGICCQPDHVRSAKVRW